MKILIVALPRAGTKFAQINLNFYLQAKCGKTLDNPAAPESRYLGFAELLNVEICLPHNKLLLVDDQLQCGGAITSQQEEFENRLSIASSGIPVVAKYMPYSNNTQHEIETVSRLISLFDVVYYFHRDNKQEHILSRIISQKLNSWDRGEKQEQLITQSYDNKININPQEVEYMVKSIASYNTIIEACRTPKCRDIYFEKLITVKTSTEFCTMFNIESLNFSLYLNSKEYGDRKFNMINNHARV